MGNYYLYRIGRFLAKILPLKVSYAVVMILCDLQFCLSRKDRLAVRENLKKVLGRDSVPVSQVRGVFRNFGKYLLEFFTLERYLQQPDFIKTKVRIDNIEYLNQVLQKGKGGILVSAHLGNWEMGGAILPLLGFPLSVVALAHKDPRVNTLFNAQRQSCGVMVVQANVAVRRIVEHLEKNRLVAILAERDFGNRGLLMDFFGFPTMIPKGAAYFSLKTGAPIIPIFFLRRPQDHFEVRVYPPLEPPHVPEATITKDTLANYIRKYLSPIEAEIRKDPSQWLLFREFWQS